MDMVFIGDDMLMNYEEYKEQKEKKKNVFRLGLTPSIKSATGIIKNQTLTDFMLEQQKGVMR